MFAGRFAQHLLQIPDFKSDIIKKTVIDKNLRSREIQCVGPLKTRESLVNHS